MVLHRDWQALSRLIPCRVVIIALYRPRLTADDGVPASAEARPGNAACWRAASTATDFLRELIDLDLIANLPSEMCVT